MKRRDFIRYATALSSGLALGSLSGWIFAESDRLSARQRTAVSEHHALRIPPIIEYRYSRRYAIPTLYVQDTVHEFAPGHPSPAVGLSTAFQHCSYLGPTIKVKRGDRVDFSIVNLRPEAVTNHWHGLHIPGHIDGGPHQMIEPGEEWKVTMPVVQEMSTNWYHAHTCEKTAPQVYMGHAGLFIVDEPGSSLIGLPDQYGVNDIPLVVQDKLFNERGEQILDLRGNPIFVGDHIVVNGTLNPFLSVRAGLIRFRILNASNDRHYQFQFKDGRPFHVIAGDGGLLNQPIEVNRVELYSGERAEIVVDFSSDGGGVIDLIAKTIVVNSQGGDLMVQILRLAVSGVPAPWALLPEQLRHHDKWIDWEGAVQSAPPITRSFKLGADPDLEVMHINNMPFDMNVINETVPINTTEVWEVVSLTGGHPFHVHGCSFLILDIDGKPPAEEFRGWKDIVVLPLPEPGTPIGEPYRARILVKFEHDTRRNPNREDSEVKNAYSVEDHVPYMYHCHLLEHEDRGMMGQFTVS